MDAFNAWQLANGEHVTEQIDGEEVVHDWRVHPVDCPARPEGAATCDTGAHAMSGRSQ